MRVKASERFAGRTRRVRFGNRDIMFMSPGTRRFVFTPPMDQKWGDIVAYNTKKQKSRPFRINCLGGNCSYVIDFLRTYTYQFLRVGLSYVFSAADQALPFQSGNFQRANYIRGIARGQLEARFLRVTELVVVGTAGQTQEVLEEARNESNHGGPYQNVYFFRSL